MNPSQTAPEASTGNDPESAVNPLFSRLDPRNRKFIRDKRLQYGLTVQDTRILTEITIDLEMWDAGAVESFWDDSLAGNRVGKQRKQPILAHIQSRWEQLKRELPDYTRTRESPLTNGIKNQPSVSFQNSDNSIMGLCPVFSDKTRCCNLLTLDVVMNCGFGCTYCSIQSFYHGETIIFQGNLRQKLEAITLEPDKTYHIGTGQSSDSLLWGNKNNVLEDLFDWVKQHPNVILELKTKSTNTGYLLEHEVPSNVIVTWSLNVDKIVRNEELRTASLKSRIHAARKVADKGLLTGFHLHPIVAFQGWEDGYKRLVSTLVDRFSPDEVALVSLGTLTFIKPVIRQLRERKQKSKLLQMPFEDAAGKLSYPLSMKRNLFKSIYEWFSPWHNEVYFYLCMEDTSLWPEVFGYSYPDNEAFEQAMKSAYLDKINRKRAALGLS